MENLTDGDAGGSVDIQTFGIGINYNPALLGEIDSDDPTAVVSTDELANAFATTPLFGAALVSFSISLAVDGDDLGEIADETDLASVQNGLGFVLPLAELEGLADLFGSENVLSVTAEFDLDGKLATEADREVLFISEVLSKADAAVDLSGTDGADLLLASDQADVLDGGDGADLMLGYGGDDTLRVTGADQAHAGSGDDVFEVSGDVSGAVLDGGTGRDVLRLLDGDAEDLALVDLSGIEEIDLTNGAPDVLSLDLDAVLGLSDTAEVDVDLLLGASTTVRGEVGDILLLGEGAEDVVLANNGEPVSDAAGGQFLVYDLIGPGDAVLATVAVDADVTVATATAAAI
ncbi:MAG: hypothetical protein AAFX00_03485 [Pseudomonadota bacterium]